MNTMLVSTAVVMAGVSTAIAGVEDAVLYTFTAVNEQGSASFDVMLSDLQMNMDDGSLSWSLGAPVDLMSESGDMVGRVETSGFSWSDTELNARGGGSFPTASLALEFSVTAGGLDTDFIISAGNTLTDTFIIPVYEATAAITVTDTEAGGGSATATANGTNAPDFYNFGFDGSNVDGLIPGPLTTGISTTASDFTGPTNFGSSIDALFANFAFSLTANDLASGTSFLTVTDVVPAPSTAALLALGGFTASRRRR